MGLRVTLAGFPGTSKVTEALTGGSVEVAASVLEHSLQMAAEGRRIPGFGLMFLGPLSPLVVSPKTSRKIERIADLRGARLGVASVGSQTHLFANYLLERENLPLDSVATIGIGIGTTSLSALERGVVDAGFINYAGYLMLQQRFPGLRTLVDPADPASPDDYRYPCAAICAKREWLNANPESARKLVSGLEWGLRHLRSTPAAQLIDQIPPDCLYPERAVNVRALQRLQGLYSPSSAFPMDTLDRLSHVVGATFPKVRSMNLDAAAVFTNEFAAGVR